MTATSERRRGRFSIEFSEAVSNLRSRPSLTLAVLALATIAFSTTGVLELRAAMSARSSAQALVGDGYTTIHIRPDGQRRTGVPAEACEAFDSTTGVLGATWINEEPAIRLWGERGPELPLHLAGVRIIELLDVTDAFAEDRVGSAIFLDVAHPAARIDGRTVPMRVLLDGQHNERITATPAALATFGSGYQAHAIVVAVTPPSDLVSGCIAVTDLDNRTATFTAASVAFPAEDGFDVSWGIGNSARIENPIDQFRHSPARGTWILASALIIGTNVFVLRIRRTDRAFYASAGLGLSRLTALVMVELVLPLFVAAGVTAGFLVALGVSRAPADLVLAVATPASCRAALCTVAVSAVAAAYQSATSAERIVDDLKDR